jgi:virginiamycin B lyase
VKSLLVVSLCCLAACSARGSAINSSVPFLPAWHDRESAVQSLRSSPEGFAQFYKDARPGGYPIGQIVRGPDANLWFADTSSIGRLTPDGKQTKFAPDAAGGIIANGPTQALWFTSFDALGNPAISRITTDGSIKNFPIPSKLFVIALTSGPDNNEWYADNGQDSVGKITPTGNLTEYQLPDAHTHRPVAIAGGPDGNVWFAAVDFYGQTPEVGRVTPNGAITEFPLASCTQDSDSIALGSDGNLWTSAYCSSGYSMVRVTPSGAITAYRVAHPVIEMTTGTDGELWGSFDKYLIEFNTTTHAQAAPVQTPPIRGHATKPWALAATVRGDMWVTVNTSNRLPYIGVYHTR